MASPAVDDVRHAWRVAWAAFVVAIFGWGVGFYGPGVYLVALHRVHGWSIATISLAITAHFLVSAVLITALPDAYRRLGVASVTIAG
ncbi:MAG TPA: MFS transporter, partial [Reyranella sp.]|nr:MFS transporter [Reyranella sp.]